MESKQKHITQPADWWDAFKAAAEADGLSLSEWLGLAGIERLPNRVASNLSARPGAHRPKNH